MSVTEGKHPLFQRELAADGSFTPQTNLCTVPFGFGYGRQLTQSNPPCHVGHHLTDSGVAIWDKIGLFHVKRTHDPLIVSKHPFQVVLGGNNVPCVREIGRSAHLDKITAPGSAYRIASSPWPMEPGSAAQTNQ